MSVQADFTVRRHDFLLDVHFDLPPGSTTAIVGPNGSGKTTVLRALAGLVPISTGTIQMHGRIVDDTRSRFVPPAARQAGYLPQHYGLFPHMTVLDNVAFGLRAQGASRRSARQAAGQLLARAHLEDLSGRKPATLSGGQTQRVALVQALAPSPQLLLLDEPLAAVDARAKHLIRNDLAHHLRAYRGTTVIVTHDPMDALTLSERILVLEHGQLVQAGPPEHLMRYPATDYVASIAEVAIVRGQAHAGRLATASGRPLWIADHRLQGPCVAVIRPETVTLHRDEPRGSARNTWQGQVRQMRTIADRVIVHVDGDPHVIAAITQPAAKELHLAPGLDVWVSVKALEIHAHPDPAAQ